MDPIIQTAVIMVAVQSDILNADAGAQLFGMFCGMVILVCAHFVYRQIERRRQARLAAKRINDLKARYYDR